jgi:hypothetical protein
MQQEFQNLINKLSLLFIYLSHQDMRHMLIIALLFFSLQNLVHILKLKLANTT